MATKTKTTTATKPTTTPEIEAAKKEVVETYTAFRSAFSTALERAVDNGKAITRLQALCDKAKVKFVEVLKELGISTATAYTHRDVALAWDKCQEAVRISGVEVELRTIKDVLTYAKQPKELAEEVEVGKVGQRAVQSPASTTKRPAGMSKAKETAIKSLIESLYGQNVRIEYPKNNQKIDLQLAGEIIIVIPVK